MVEMLPTVVNGHENAWHVQQLYRKIMYINPVTRLPQGFPLARSVSDGSHDRSSRCVRLRGHQGLNRDQLDHYGLYECDISCRASNLVRDNNATTVYHEVRSAIRV